MEKANIISTEASSIMRVEKRYVNTDILKNKHLINSCHQHHKALNENSLCKNNINHV